jgi:hypothetical protein
MDLLLIEGKHCLWKVPLITDDWKTIRVGREWMQDVDIIKLILPVCSTNHSRSSDGDDHKYPTPAMFYTANKALSYQSTIGFLNKDPAMRILHRCSTNSLWINFRRYGLGTKQDIKTKQCVQTAAGCAVQTGPSLITSYCHGYLDIAAWACARTPYWKHETDKVGF